MRIAAALRHARRGVVTRGTGPLHVPHSLVLIITWLPPTPSLACSFGIVL